MMKRTAGLLYKILPQLLLAGVLITGFFIYDDYGLSWDEEAQVFGNGEIVFQYIKTGDSRPYLENPEKYHGPAFELILTSLQHSFNFTELSELRTIYLFRHFCTFIVYWISGLALYFILKRKYADTFIIFTGLCWYFLMPRIFADSFYNSKDVPLLAMNMVCILSMMRFLENPSIKNSVIHGLFCGFTIAIRITGAIIPAVSLGFIIVRIISNSYGQKSWPASEYLKACFVFVLTAIAFTIACWPILWLDPLFHFTAAWKEMSRFRYDTTLLYQGHLVRTIALPWHYNFVWILISTPLHYILFFIAGLVFTLINLFKVGTSPNNFEVELTGIILFFVPLVLIVVLQSVVYDAWRHSFFVYAPFLIIAIRGLFEVKRWLAKKIKPVWINLGILLITFPVAFTMISMHPYQNVYFNRAVGPNSGYARFQYDLDYWGLAFRKALEKLSEKSNDPIIKVNARNPTGRMSLNILSSDIHSRFEFVDYKDAKYFITDYRWEQSEIPFLNKIDSIQVDGAVISSTFLK